MEKTRRNILKALALAPVIALTGYYINSPGYQDLIIDAIKKRLSYLTLDEEGVKAFARDYSGKYKKNKLKLVAIDLTVILNETFPWIESLDKRVTSYEDFIVAKFLKSSDFFRNGSDEKKLVKYMGLDYSDPYKAVCNNVFARFTDENG
jgi:hypothetical protein